MTLDFCETQNKSLDKISGQLVFLNVALLALEREQGGRALVSQIYRSVQSVRATCRQAGYSELEELASDLEDLLRLVRDDIIDFSSDLLILFRNCAEAFECGVDSLRIGVPLSYAIEEVQADLHRMLINSSLDVTNC